MDTQNFIRIERDEKGSNRHFVVNRKEPGFSVEVITQSHPDGQRKQPIIRRICMPNSWAANYHRYSRLLVAAESFLEQCDGLTVERRFI
jgi:hypothetical protein